MKRFLISLFMVGMLQFPGYCQDAYYCIDSFDKGLNSHISEYSLPKNQSVVCENFRINDEFGNLTKRAPMVLVVDGGTASINGTYKYYKSDDTDKLVWATSTYLKYDNSGTAVTLEEGLSDGKYFQFVTYQDIAIMMNGTNNDMKWDGETTTTANTDGARTALNLTADLGAPFAELNTGANLDAAAWYQYKVGYYDGTTYSYSTARSNAILTGAAVQDISLTDIPLGVTGTTHRYIYRTLGNASKANCEADTTFYKIATIADNTTRTANDAIDDATAAGDAAPTWATVAAGTNATPPIGAYGVIHQERLFKSGNSTNKSDIYWSDEYNPDYFDAADYESIRPDDGDEVTFLNTVLGMLIIGKTNTIQKYYTDADSEADWYCSNPLSHVGCPSPYSVANTPKGVYYFGRFGLWNFNGQYSTLISDAVTEQMNDIAESNVENVVGFYFNNKYYFSYCSRSSGESINNRVLIYDLVRDAYTQDTTNINCFVALDSGDDFGVVYSGSSDTDGYVYAHELSVLSLRKRYKSDLDAGTFDDGRSTGTENDPEMELAWDCTIDGWLTELQTKDVNISTINDVVTYLPNAIIDRPDTDGTWVSPIYRIDAAAYDKLYWNESLATYGDITFNIKPCDDAACSGDSYGAINYSSPTGTDVSGLTAQNWIQIRVNLSTSDIDYSPTLYVENGYLFKLLYSQTGSTYEGSYLSKWDSGWRNFYKNQVTWIKAIRIYYKGDTGSFTVRYYNEEGDIDTSFDVDLTINPGDDSTDAYLGTAENKSYVKYLPFNEEGENIIGRWWRFEITNESIDDFTLEKVCAKFSVTEDLEWEGE